MTDATTPIDSRDSGDVMKVIIHSAEGRWQWRVDRLYISGKPGASLILIWITALWKQWSWLRCVQYYILLELQSAFNMHSMQRNGIYQVWAWQP